MRIQSKSFKVEKTISKITVEHFNSECNKYPSEQVKAVYALLGGYNQVARHVDYETFALMKRKFNDIVDDLGYLMNKE